jgi:hypothetical protein
MSDRSGRYKFPSYEILTEGRVGLLEVFLRLISAGIIGGVCYILWLVLKLIVTHMICKHPELTNEKVKYITNMISKNKHIF